MTDTMTDAFVRTPASSANLGAGFDVLAMALDVYADCGLGTAPPDSQQLDEHHPGRLAFEALGGTGPMWMRCNIPMARGLGFSGAARVGAASLAAVQAAGTPCTQTITDAADRILSLATDLEGHGDNAAASLHGGVTAYIDGKVVAIDIGPTMAAASFVAWIPEVTTSTDASRKTLGPDVARSDAVFNIGRSIQFVAAFQQDDPSLLVGAADDRMHQQHRLPLVPGAADALEAGVGAGAWAGWLSGSGPTVGFFCAADLAGAIESVLPSNGHVKVLSIDARGTRVES